MATARSARNVTPHATDALSPRADALQVGTGGTVVCRTPGTDADVTFTVPDGGYVACQVTHVRDSSTAADIVALNF